MCTVCLSQVSWVQDLLYRHYQWLLILFKHGWWKTTLLLWIIWYVAYSILCGNVVTRFTNILTKQGSSTEIAYLVRKSLHQNKTFQCRDFLTELCCNTVPPYLLFRQFLLLGSLLYFKSIYQFIQQQQYIDTRTRKVGVHLSKPQKAYLTGEFVIVVQNCGCLLLCLVFGLVTVVSE